MMERSVLGHAIIAIFILFLSTHINTSSATSPSSSNTNIQYIKTSCSNTTYPKLCYNSLSSYADKIQNNPKMLALVALNVTLAASKSALELMNNLSKHQGLNPREAAAMEDCIEAVDQAVDELKKSIGEMGRARGSNSDPAVNDIQTWVSAALTDDSTCMDGFAVKDTDGVVKNIVLGNMTEVAHLTSIALALINRFASSQGNADLVL